MDVQGEAYALCVVFGVMILFISILCLFQLKLLKKSILNFVFYVMLVAQLALRCTFLIMGLFLDQNRFGNFYNNFPAAVFSSLCTFVLLEWIKTSTNYFTHAMVFYLLLNVFIYIFIFLLFAIEVYLAPSNILIYFACLNCLLWFSIAMGIFYFLFKTYPWADPAREWTDRKKTIILGLLGTALCLVIRCTLLILATIIYSTVFYLTSQEIPTGMFFVYWCLGELLPCIFLLMVQLSLPSILSPKPYSELERLIQKINEEKIDYSSDPLLCKICLEKEINTAFLPCRHSIVCEDCSILIELCPLCRNPIGQTILIYRS